jgi:hypothetical protein
MRRIDYFVGQIINGLTAHPTGGPAQLANLQEAAARIYEVAAAFDETGAAIEGKAGHGNTMEEGVVSALGQIERALLRQIPPRKQEQKTR